MSSNERKVIRVGSRKSELALIQTKYVISCLQKLYPDIKFEIHTMTTMGDRVLNKSLPKIGEKSLFTKDLENALTDGGVDFVVHSLKDLPTSLPVGMAIGAILEREDPRDALVLNEKFKGKKLATLPKGSVIGTSSLRRSAQLSRSYKNVTVCDIRGNLNTRLAKLDAPQSKFSGIILAQAGLVRMKWGKRVDQILEPSDLLYAVGQGALAVECRSNDDYVLDMLSSLCHLNTQCTILAERSFLKTLGGGCSAPVAVCTNLKRKKDSKEYELDIKGAVWSLDGNTEMQEDVSCKLNLEYNGIDDQNNGICPSKKSKFEECVTTPDKNCSIEDKRKSPEIIDDSKPSCSRFDSGDNINLEKLINIHGEIFKQCPFSSQVEKKEVEHTEEIIICPQSPQFPVGQDFMGECPFFDTQQKVELQEQMKCPITGKTEEELQKVENIEEKAEKCPFLTHKEPLKCPISGKTEEDLQKVENIEEKIDKCPFLTNQVQLLDYNENLNREIIQPKIIDNSNQLFCGMYRHKYVSKDVFVECEQLGIRLATNLIKKGALEVMKCAQNEIHSKIEK